MKTIRVLSDLKIDVSKLDGVILRWIRTIFQRQQVLHHFLDGPVVSDSLDIQVEGRFGGVCRRSNVARLFNGLVVISLRILCVSAELPDSSSALVFAL